MFLFSLVVVAVDQDLANQAQLFDDLCARFTRAAFGLKRHKSPSNQHESCRYTRREYRPTEIGSLVDRIHAAPG